MPCPDEHLLHRSRDRATPTHRLALAEDRGTRLDELATTRRRVTAQGGQIGRDPDHLQRVDRAGLLGGA